MEIARGVIKEIRNFESLDNKMRDLKRRMDYLESREEDIRTELDYADSLMSMKKRRRTVETWLTNVGGMKNQVQRLEQEVAESRFYNYPQLQKTIEKLTGEAKELIQLGAFQEGLTLVAPDSQGLLLLTTELVGQKFEEQKNMVREVILRNVDILCIGIYGMGGVGKTTLVKHVYNELLNHSNSSVFWVVASQNFSIHKLQNDIANAIKAEFVEEHDVSRRAAILAESLKTKENPILIFDDLWDYFPLESAGIVRGGGCKLIFTTRSLKVCYQMESHMQIKVETLSDEDAWELFMKTLGTGTPLTPQIEEIAESLVRECDGLPLGIITVAGSMRGVDDICQWRNAQETLRQATGWQDDELEFEKVFHVLRYSYDMLKSQTLKECFLYCSLYPEDHEIDREELIANFVDEGLISRMRSRQLEFDRGHTILNVLENVCLLQGGIDYNGIKYVKMHDLIRDMALQIANESSRFLVKEGIESADVDEEKWSEGLERVSFLGSNLSSISSGVSQPICPRLLTLLLRDCRYIKVIPNSFFTHMNRLTVLDLSWTRIENLPSSISNLKSLSALLLRGCGILDTICPLSDLKALKRLDLSFTRITELPEGMNMLTNLRDLSLYGADSLEMIPEGILTRLSHLQRLQLPRYGGKAKVKGEEIACLKKLETFEGIFYDINDLQKYLSSWEESRPNKYLLAVDTYHVTNLGLKVNGLTEMDKIVQITNCHDLGALCELESLKKATDLKKCSVSHCRGMKNVLCSRCYSIPFFESLEFLELENLGDLCELLEGGSGASAVQVLLPTDTFSTLKAFKIVGCPKIKKLFTLALLSHLRNLDTFIVDKCEQLVELVQVPDEDRDQEATSSTIVSTLPKLKTLILHDLPELKSFCSNRKLVSDSLEEISIILCPRLRRIPLLREDPHPPTSLQRISLHETLWGSLEFDSPNTKGFLTPSCHFI